MDLHPRMNEVQDHRNRRNLQDHRDRWNHRDHRDCHHYPACRNHHHQERRLLHDPPLWHSLLPCLALVVELGVPGLSGFYE